MVNVRLKVPLRRIRSFVSRYAWVARDGLRGKGVLVVIITALSMAAAAIGGITLGLSGKIINILQGGVGITLPYVDITLQGVSLILTSTLSITTLLILASYASFYSKLKTRALARAYFAESIARILDLINNRTVIIRADQDHEISSIRVMVGRNAQQISRSLEKMVMMLQPLSYVMAAVVTASYLNLKFSLISYSLFLFLIVPLYRKSSEFNENSRMFFQKTNTEMSRNLRKYINYLEGDSFSVGKTKSVGEEYMREITVQEYMDRFDNLRLAPAKMVLLTSLFMAIAVGMGMLGVGYMLVVEQQELGTSLAFIGALILLLKSLQNLGASLAMLNRFYPQTVDYLDFYWALQEAPESTSSELPEMLTISAGRNRYAGSQASMVLNHGEPGIVVCDRKLNRSNLSYIGGCILDACDIGGSCHIDFVGRQSRPDNISVGDYLAIPGKGTGEGSDLMRLLEEFKISDELEKLPDGFDTILDEDTWPELSSRLTSLLLILALSGTKGPIAMIDGSLLNVFEDMELKKIWALFAHRYLLILSNSAGNLIPAIKKGMIINDGQVKGVGDIEWLQRTGVEFDVRITEAGLLDNEDDLDDME